ncbi:hypothetical protein J31TS4_05840 [Paenibacillus sp. J31TS4]|uniref:serine/threonine protein kinase n=1 Tax=Paenibacillus sp. J31TS4 TaxID=2807195 RepID=UPI001B2177E4|nr:serine/threonine-protein kinase [Paenibacillus sp. J31TS4]GIP37304.1 hypothetical protein J31TS4_05840 [Paenibacillus sp. J31TS4]
MPSVPHLRSGDQLAGRYRIRHLIGQGGMSRVYLAEDMRLVGKQWAVKQSLTEYENGLSFREEAEVLIGLDHPFLPKLVDYVPPTEEGVAYLIMDFIKGKTLQKLHEEEGPLGPERVGKYALQLCELFRYLHEHRPKPIIYRDLKPSNVMIDEQDNVRLIDFGIARNYRQGGTVDTIQLGTLGYAAPEQFTRTQTDPRTDLYSLGAVLYSLLSGGVLYPSRPAPGSFLASGQAEGWRSLIAKLLMERPEDRLQSAEELGRELNRLLAGLKPLGQRNGPRGESSTSDGARLVLVGSLYPGAGSTFVAVALARSLDRLGQASTLIEHAGNRPELFALLGGEQTQPYGYSSYIERPGPHRPEQTSAWMHGRSEWLPLPPDYGGRGRSEEWTEEDYYRLLYDKKGPVTIIDCSCDWGASSLLRLSRSADYLVIVGDPMAYKWSSHEAMETIAALESVPDNSGKIVWVANKCTPFRQMKEWLRAFPDPPLCRVPLLPEKLLLESAWEEKLVQDHKEAASVLQETLQPLLKRLASPAGVKPPGRRTAFLTRLL